MYKKLSIKGLIPKYLKPHLTVTPLHRRVVKSDVSL